MLDDDGRRVSSLTHGHVSVPKGPLRELKFYAKRFGMSTEEYVLANHDLVKQEVVRIWGGINSEALSADPKRDWVKVMRSAADRAEDDI